MTTKQILMSADVGFEALTESRRRSLMNIADKLSHRHARSSLILEAMVDDKAFAASHVKSATKVRDRYKTLRDIVLLQFPEIRADKRGKFSWKDAWSNIEINEEAKLIDQGLADASGLGVRDLRSWFHQGGSVPKLSPLFARHWGEKAEAKAAREAREKEARDAKGAGK